MCICACLITDPMVFANRRTDRDAANAALETFRRLLNAVIELRKNKELIVVVDHVDQLSGEPLASLRTTLQVIHEMMDSRLATKLHYVLVGKPIRENKALKGFAIVDDNTEYHNKLQGNSCCWIPLIGF